MKKYIILVLTLTFLAGLLFFLDRYSSPFIQKKILSELEKVSTQTKTEWSWSQMNVKPLLLKAEFENFRGHFQTETPQQDLAFDKFTLQISLFQSLIQGRAVFNIKISGFSYFINLAQETKGFRNNFDDILKSPINSIYFQKTDLKIKTLRGEFLSQNTKAGFKKKTKGILSQIESSLVLKENRLSFKTSFNLKKDRIDIESLFLSEEGSEASVSGRIEGSPQKIKSFLLDIKTSFYAKSLYNWIELWRDPSDFKAQGFFKITSQLQYSKKGFRGPFEIESKDFSWRHIAISRIKLKGQAKKKFIELSLAHFEKKGKWTSYFENIKFHFNSSKNFRFNSYSYIRDFQEVSNLFKWKHPFKLQGPVDSECFGNLKKPFLKCKINSKIRNLSMENQKNQSVFHLEKSQWSFDLDWQNQQTTLKGRAKSSSSDISFQAVLKDRVFQIPFRGVLDFSDFQHIQGFELKGSSTLKKGLFVSKKEGFSLKTSAVAQNFSLSQYAFGNIRTQILLNNTGLYLNKFRGHIGKSLYRGNMHILFKTKDFLNVQARFSPLFLEDLNSSVKKNLPLPFTVFGKGKAHLKIKSTLKETKYQLSSQFKNIKIHNEFFKNLVFDMESHDGVFQIKKGILRKPQGFIQAEGYLFNPKKQISVSLKGMKLPLEKSELFQDILRGSLNFSSSIRGSLNRPSADFSAQISNSPLGDSKIKLHLKSSKLQGSAEFFNKQLIVNKFNLSRRKIASFDLLFNNWDFINFFKQSRSPLVSSETIGRAFLTFPIQNPLKLSGNLNIDKVHLKYGTKRLSNLDPFHVELDRSKFRFQGPHLTLKEENKTIELKKINSNKSRILGDVSLEFLNLAPFFAKNIGGNLKTNITITNDIKNLKPEGDFHITEGILDSTKYLDTFQSVEIIGNFSENKAEIQKIKAFTSFGGEVSGEGWVALSEHYPLDINLILKNKLGFYLSENIQGKGYGSLRIYGERKPYTLSGDFYITEGAFKHEFQSFKNQAPLADSDLKKNNLFYWDMNVQFENPVPVENTLFSSYVKGGVHLRGSLTNPETQGLIQFSPGGRFYLREYDFEILSGQLAYNQEPLFKPQIQITGQSDFEEISYENEREIKTLYQITAHISGSPSNIQFKLNSQPELSESEILSMMALGGRSIGFEGPIDQVASYSYSQIGSALLQSFVGRELTKLLGVRLTLAPYINSETNRYSAKIGLRRKWLEKMNTSFVRSLDEDYNSFEVEYSLSPALSLSGVWERKIPLNQEHHSNTLGFEFEYKLDF